MDTMHRFHRRVIETVTMRSGRFVLAMSITMVLRAFALASVCAAQTNEWPHLSQRIVPAPASATPVLLSAGDVIEVRVFETPELSIKTRIDEAGKITLPAAGPLEVAGLTPAQASAAVEKLLRESDLMLAPHVSVLVDEYATQGVTLLGEVRNPGTYTMLGARSLYEALSIGGGVTPNQGGSITISHRRDPGHPVEIKVTSPNYSEVERANTVEPGDTIVVSKADMIYVVGDVAHPGAYYVQNGEPMSVLNAVALASGLNHTAAASRASIVRKTDSGATIIPLDLNRIMKNSQPNRLLLASDILVVPRSGTKVLLETALPSATAAVTGAVSTALVLR